MTFSEYNPMFLLNRLEQGELDGIEEHFILGFAGANVGNYPNKNAKPPLCNYYALF